MPIHLLLSKTRLLFTQLLLNIYQKSYAYWLFILPDCYLTNKFYL